MPIGAAKPTRAKPSISTRHTPQIEAVSAYLQSDIWILNHEGTIVADSSDSRTGIAIDDFDPTAQGNRLYSIGQYYNLFDSKVLSVSAPTQAI